jgi:hypothetical protein
MSLISLSATKIDLYHYQGIFTFHELKAIAIIPSTGFNIHEGLLGKE